MNRKTKIEDMLRFREECLAKGQMLSKPKYETLIKLLLTELAAHNLDDNAERTLH